jgi:hypothetical protein
VNILPVVYTICQVEKFKRQDHYSAPTQIRLEGFEEYPESNYNLLNPDFLQLNYGEDDEPIQVSSYSVYQDLLVNKYGKVYGREFYSYLIPQQFEMYYLDHLKILIINAGKDSVHAFLDRMNSDEGSGFKAKTYDVDFKTLLPLIPVVSGAWVAEIKKPNLKTAGFFGRNVDRDEQFRQAAQEGVVSSLQFEYSPDCWRHETLKIQITRNGAIVLFTRIIDPKTKKLLVDKEIEVVTELFIKYLKK